MFSIYDRSVLHSFGEIVQRYKFWWRSPVDGAQRLGLLRAQPALGALAAPPDRRGLQRLVHVPGPDADAAARSGCRCPLFIKWDDSEFGLRAGEAGYPTVTLPGCRGVAHPVDRQERRARLAGLLPPPQPADRGAAALAVPPGRVAGPGELRALGQAPGLDAVLHRRAPAQGDRGRLRRVRSDSTRRCRRVLPEINAFRKQWPDAVLEAERDAFPHIRRSKPPRRGKDDDTEVPRRATC